MLVLLASAGDTGSDGDVGFCWYRWFCWFRLVMPMMLAVSGVAGDAGSADDAGFCWCLDLLLMFVLGGCSDDIVVQKNEIVKSTKNTNTFKKHFRIHKLWPKSFKKEALGQV